MDLTAEQYHLIVAKLVKSFGCLGEAAESLDGFRYTRVTQVGHTCRVCLSLISFGSRNLVLAATVHRWESFRISR